MNLILCTPGKFADDAYNYIMIAGTDVKQINKHILDDPKQNEKWLIANRLSFNETKTKYMIIGSANRINNRPIPFISPVYQLKGRIFVNLLGMCMDEHLAFKRRIEHDISRPSTGLERL